MDLIAWHRPLIQVLPLPKLQCRGGAKLQLLPQLALQRTILQAKLPNLKTLAEYQLHFPKKLVEQKVIRLFDCEFIEQHRPAVLVGPTGVGKTHLLTAPGYTACERGITVRFTRVIDMINRLTATQGCHCHSRQQLPYERRQCRRIVASSVSHPLDQP